MLNLVLDPDWAPHSKLFTLGKTGKSQTFAIVHSPHGIALIAYSYFKDKCWMWCWIRIEHHIQHHSYASKHLNDVAKSIFGIKSRISIPISTASICTLTKPALISWKTGFNKFLWNITNSIDASSLIQDLTTVGFAIAPNFEDCAEQIKSGSGCRRESPDVLALIAG